MVFRRKRYTSRRPRRVARKSRRFGYRKKRMARTQKSVSRTVGGFNDRMFVKLRYCRTGVALGDGAAQGDVAILGLTDPLNSAGFGIAGQSPIGWTQFAAAYDNYIVHASTIKATYSNLSTTVPIRATIVPVDEDQAGLTAITNTNNISSNRLVKMKYLSVLTGGQAVKTIYNGVKVSKLVGATKLKNTDADHIANTGSTNSNNPYTAPVANYAWVIGVMTSNLTNLALNSCYVDYEVTYFIEFFGKLATY